MQMTLIERENCPAYCVHSRYTRIDTKRKLSPFLVGDGKPLDFGFRNHVFCVV